jgi:hypothetical protein
VVPVITLLAAGVVTDALATATPGVVDGFSITGHLLTRPTRSAGEGSCRSADR